MKKVLPETPSQTAGPYVHIGTLPRVAGIDARPADDLANTALTRGPAIIIEGTIRDGDGELVRDAMVEIWQVDGEGTFDESGHRGWARTHTDFETGLFRFETVKPGAVPDANRTWQAPHITLLIFARGINLHLHTRIYFADEAEANGGDTLLSQLDDGRRATLLAQPAGPANNTYRFDVALQGDNETVFLDI